MPPKVARAWKGLYRLTRMRTRQALQPLTGLRSYRFNGDYREKVTLETGGDVRIRLLRVGDRAFLQAGMRGLSEESRYLRFHSAKSELTQDELRYLTEIDHVRHVALIAYHRLGVHREGVAVARFVCLPGQESRAEAALVVADAFQRQGLGRILLERLCAAAAERGVTVFVCEVLSSNRAALQLLLDHFSAQVIAYEGMVAIVEIDLRQRVWNSQ